MPSGHRKGAGSFYTAATKPTFRSLKRRSNTNRQATTTCVNGSYVMSTSPRSRRTQQGQNGGISTGFTLSLAAIESLRLEREMVWQRLFRRGFLRDPFHGHQNFTREVLVRYRASRANGADKCTIRPDRPRSCRTFILIL